MKGFYLYLFCRRFVTVFECDVCPWQVPDALDPEPVDAAVGNRRVTGDHRFKALKKDFQEFALEKNAKRFRNLLRMSFSGL